MDYAKQMAINVHVKIIILDQNAIGVLKDFTISPNVLVSDKYAWALWNRKDWLSIEKIVEIRNWSFTVLSHLLFCFMNFYELLNT